MDSIGEPFGLEPAKIFLTYNTTPSKWFLFILDRLVFSQSSQFISDLKKWKEQTLSTARLSERPLQSILFFDSFKLRNNNYLPIHPINIEKELLIKVAQGDELAFGQLFKTYYNQLGDFIMRIAESKPLTQEIVQDVFLKIWINRASLSNIESFKAYLFVVARNHAFNCLKQLARERNRKKDWINSVLQDASYSSDDTAEIDAGALVDEAVDLLPPQQKKVYTLSRREGLKQEEIARELNVSLETVKKHMVLALRFIRNYLRSHIGILIFFIAGFLKR